MRNTTPRSGISKKPNVKTFLDSAYPTLLPLSLTPEIKGPLCYIIKHYGVEGLSISIDRRRTNDDVEVSLVYGDWRGNRIGFKDGTKLASAAIYFQEHYALKTMQLMKVLALPSIKLFMVIGNSDLVLTDIMTGPYKLTGPGMVRDIFGKMMMTQEVIKIEQIDERVALAIDKGTGSYAGELIIKPSKFRTVERQEIGTCPLYVEVRR